MKVLVIGGGGREHAIVWKLKQSSLVTELYCAPGNAGIARDATCVAIAATDLDALLKFSLEHAIDLTVVGPENPLVAGIVDLFQNAGLKIVGPTAAAARLEGSKEFAKEFMRRHNIPTAAFQTFTRDQHAAARAYVASHELPVVVKADGLAAGKGVVVCTTGEEATYAIDAMFGENVFGDAGSTIVVEDFLLGEEASVFAMTDGTSYVTFAAAQDHKRIGDGDTGKNTGGMGAFAPAGIVTASIMERVKHEIIEPVLRGMRDEGCPFTGFLFCGLMIGPDGPKVVEFNCRLGDPETEVVLPLLDVDFAALCLACAESRMQDVDVSQYPGSAVCVVLASGGYPDAYETGKLIRGLDDAAALRDIQVFHAGTRLAAEGVVTAGGRVLAVTAIGKEQRLAETIARAYDAAGKISFDGAYYRRDIGKKG